MMLVEFVVVMAVMAVVLVVLAASHKIVQVTYFIFISQVLFTNAFESILGTSISLPKKGIYVFSF